jgi:signal transduction histidine kinase
MPFRMPRRALLAVAISVGLSLALMAVGWRDYLLARRELGALVRAQAASVRDAVAAAARANLASADQAQEALADRLLDNARLLAELDRRSRLTEADVAAAAGNNHLFRVVVFGGDGSRELTAGTSHLGARPGWGAGAGLGMGPGGGELVDRLLRGSEREVVTGLHTGRRDGNARLAAGVRRTGGGAIVISVDATDVAQLLRQSGLSQLLDDLVSHTSDVAYLAFSQGSVRITSGPLPTQTTGAGVAVPPERELTVNGRPVLEMASTVDLRSGRTGAIVLGMRLDGLREAERRTLTRLAASLCAAALLGVLAIGLAWLRERYGALSVDHARAQEALHRRDRLAAMGELASTVAHEIRNPLNAIAMSAQRLSREYFGGGPLAAAETQEAGALVGVVAGEAARLDTKVRQFLEFARPRGIVPRPTRLAEWLPPIAAGLASLAATRGVTLTCDDVPDAIVVLDPDQVREVLDNLLRNAVDATPAGGRVTVGATTAAREIALVVRDTGAGIPADVLPKIFDLYFTTKAQGTGVGLAVSQQIVASHGGRIDVESSPGAGTTMRVVLPLQGPGHA